MLTFQQYGLFFGDLVKTGERKKTRRFLAITSRMLVYTFVECIFPLIYLHNKDLKPDLAELVKVTIHLFFRIDSCFPSGRIMWSARTTTTFYQDEHLLCG